MKGRWFLEATGASLLVLLPFCYPLLLPGHVALLHHELAFRNIIGGLLLDMFGVCVLGIAALALTSRLPRLPRRIVGASLTAIFLWRFIHLGVSFLQDWYNVHVEDTSAFQHPVLLTIFGNWSSWTHKVLTACMLLLLVITWVRPAVAQRLVRASRFGLSAFAFCAIWMLPQLIYIGFGLHEEGSLDHSRTIAAGQVKQRIIWILFDELSEKLLDNPPENQRFVNFDKLRSKSVLFTNIQPVGYFTERIIPSLLAGHKVDQISSTLNGEFLELEAGQHQWKGYDANATLFRDAAASGWNPAVAGWHVPYCRIFSNSLTACYWAPPLRLSVEGLGASEEKSIAENSLIIPRAYLAKVLLRPKVGATQDRIEQFQQIKANANRLIRDDQARLVFIHLPVPHPPGFFDRKTHRLCDCGNYIDNLSLADDALGELMQEIEQSSSGSDTTIIISSDHSWRVPFWKRQFNWSQEEELVSKGQFDARPVFFIHFPGEKSNDRVGSPTPELLEHDLISMMLRGRLQSARDLRTFLSPFPPSGSEQARHRPLETPVDGY